VLPEAGCRRIRFRIPEIKSDNVGVEDLAHGLVHAVILEDLFCLHGHHPSPLKRTRLSPEKVNFPLSLGRDDRPVGTLERSKEGDLGSVFDERANALIDTLPRKGSQDHVGGTTEARTQFLG